MLTMRRPKKQATYLVGGESRQPTVPIGGYGLADKQGLIANLRTKDGETFRFYYPAFWRSKRVYAGRAARDRDIVVLSRVD